MKTISVGIDWNLRHELQVPEVLTTQNELDLRFKSVIERCLSPQIVGAQNILRVSEIESLNWCSAKLLAVRSTTPLERFKANEGTAHQAPSRVGTRMHSERLRSVGGIAEPKRFFAESKGKTAEQLDEVRNAFKKASEKLKKLTDKATKVRVKKELEEDSDLSDEVEEIKKETLLQISDRKLDVKDDELEFQRQKTLLLWIKSLDLSEFFCERVSHSRFLEEWHSGFLNSESSFGSLGEVTFSAPYRDYLITGHPDHTYLYKGHVFGVVEFKTKLGKIPQYLLDDESWAVQRAGYRFLLNYVFGDRDFPIIQYAKSQVAPFTPKVAVEKKDSILFTQQVDRAINILVGKEEPETQNGECDRCDCRFKCKYKY